MKSPKDILTVDGDGCKREFEIYEMSFKNKYIEPQLYFSGSYEKESRKQMQENVPGDGGLSPRSTRQCPPPRCTGRMSY